MGTEPGQESTLSKFDAGPTCTRTNAPTACISNKSISFQGAANEQLVRHPIFHPLNEKQAEILIRQPFFRPLNEKQTKFIKAALNEGLSTDPLAVSLPWILADSTRQLIHRLVLRRWLLPIPKLVGESIFLHESLHFSP
jgi:hypothetical protein